MAHAMHSGLPDGSALGSLRIQVTDAGRDILHFRLLAQQTLPVLRTPDAYSQEEREALVSEITQALTGDESERDEYEPGSEFPDDRQESGEPW